MTEMGLRHPKKRAAEQVAAAVAPSSATVVAGATSSIGLSEGHLGAQLSDRALARLVNSPSKSITAEIAYEAPRMNRQRVTDEAVLNDYVRHGFDHVSE